MENWLFVQQKLMINQRLVLLLVIDNEGSSPGRRGFRMLLGEDGSIHGSIGGGIMEYNMVEEAKVLLKKKETKAHIRHQIHHSNAKDDSSGMICSGRQSIAFYPLGQESLALIERIIYFHEKNSGCLLEFTAQHIVIKENESQEEAFKLHLCAEDNWLYTERIGFSNAIFIFGAGHVGLALSKLMRSLDFYVNIFDDRPNLNTFNENHFAHQKELVDYKEVGHLIPDSGNNYVVIMTFAHKSDSIVLHQMLEKKLHYLGMMGSRAKVKSLFDNMIKQGYKEDALSAVYSPIGLSIKSQTPLEIAISIAAEIISVKNKK